MAEFEGNLNLNVETSEIEIKGKFKLTEKELDVVAGGNPNVDELNPKYAVGTKLAMAGVNLDFEIINREQRLDGWWYEVARYIEEIGYEAPGWFSESQVDVLFFLP